MGLNYAISLSSFFHYTKKPKLTEIIDALRDQGYGIELWREWWDEDRDLFDTSERKHLRRMLKGMRVSIHSNGANSVETHKFQIEAARDIGASILVIHRNEFCLADRKTLDPERTSQVLDFAESSGVTVAIENMLARDELSLLVDAVAQFPQMGICLDIAHVYFTPTPLEEYFNQLAPKIVHVHLQDTRPEDEASIPWSDRDNCIPGTGGICRSGWEYFTTKLEEFEYSGMAVFETRPRNPLQEAHLGRKFLTGLSCSEVA